MTRSDDEQEQHLALNMASLSQQEVDAAAARTIVGNSTMPPFKDNLTVELDLLSSSAAIHCSQADSLTFLRMAAACQAITQHTSPTIQIPRPPRFFTHMGPAFPIQAEELQDQIRFRSVPLRVR
jgi:hypothetical protein